MDSQVYFRHSDQHNGDNAEMITAGKRIRQRRMELGYTNQGEFAKLVGLSQGTLSEIETGETKLPSAEVLIRMCEVLKTTPRWIVYGEDGDISVPSKEESELLDSFRSLPADAKDQLLSFLKAMGSKAPK